MKISRTPSIRFPKFTKEWEQRELGGISEKITEKNKENIYSETLTNSAEFGIVTQRDFFKKDISNEKNLDGYYIVRPDDFVYNPRISSFAPVGPIKRNKLGRTGVMSPLYYILRTYDVDKTYMEKYFSSNSWHEFMKLNGDSGARSDRFAIKDSIFREMPIPFPSIDEQANIGKFFEDLDDNITLQQQELTTLQQTKQGFLQKMFPKEGESVPQVRFPNFVEDWEAREFQDDIISIKTGTNLLGSDRIEGIPLIKMGNIQRGYFSMNKLEYLDVNATVLDTDIVKFGDFLFNTRNTLQLVGKGATWFGESDKYAFNNNIARFTFKGINTIFFNYLYNTQEILKQINARAVGTTSVAAVYPKDLNSVKYMIPLIEEQVKIGNFFKQLDETITLCQQELSALQETKKAFLQKMFV